MSNLRIAFISPFQKRLQRGIERSTSNLALHLAQAGATVVIACRSGSIPEDSRLRHSGVRYLTVPGTRYFESTMSVPFYMNHLLRFKPDVVIVYFAVYGEAATISLLRRFRQCQVVFIVGYPMALVPHRFDEFKSTGLAQYLDHVVVKAQHMVPEIESFFGIETQCIPNGVDTAYFAPPDHKPSLALINLVTVAALEKRKGIGTVLEALPGVIEVVGNKINYTIVGEGSDRDWFQDRINSLGLQQHVSLVGEVEDVRPYLSDAHLFLLPSEGEGLPNAYLEALAMGLPTIVSDVPPYDIIAQTDFSIRVEHENIQALQAAITTLLQDHEKRGKMGTTAHQHAVETYSWQQVASEYLGYIQK